MSPKEAYEIVYQLSRATAVNAEIGDKRDEALEVLKSFIDNQDDD